MIFNVPFLETPYAPENIPANKKVIMAGGRKWKRIIVYVRGLRLFEGAVAEYANYDTYESVPGQGFDTIRFFVNIKKNDYIVVDYEPFDINHSSYLNK